MPGQMTVGAGRALTSGRGGGVLGGVLQRKLPVGGAIRTDVEWGLAFYSGAGRSEGRLHARPQQPTNRGPERSLRMSPESTGDVNH
jgi:hypothetical protein